jgi:hypothetical protein
MAKFSTVALALLLPGIVSAGVQVFEGFLSPDECQELLLDPVANLAPDKPLSFYEFKLDEGIYESLKVTISSLDCDEEHIVTTKKNPHDAHVCSMMETTSLDPNGGEPKNDDCPVFAFCVLEDNEEAYFMDGNAKVPVEQGTLVVYSGDAVLHTIISGAKPVHVLGPFYITSTDTGRRELGWGSWRKNYGHYYYGKGGYHYSKGGGKGGGSSGGKSSYGKSSGGNDYDYSSGKSGGYDYSSGKSGGYDYSSGKSGGGSRH